jgi:hypothetical protein
MKNTVVCIFAFMVISVLTTGYSFACEKPLRAEEAKASDITGTYTLILYGGNYPDDLETIAILDREGDRYNFEPYAPDFEYRVKKGEPAKKALREAEKFVSFHYSFLRSQISRIIDNKGKTIGYEVRPLYQPLTFGISDVLDVYYLLKEGGRVKVLIRLKRSVEGGLLPLGGKTGIGGRR